MKYKIFIEPEREEEIIIYAHEKNELIEKIEALIAGDREELVGYSEREVVRLCASDVYCFVVEDTKVYALTENEKLLLRERLYQLEERYASVFLKINQSCLVNVKKIARFDSSIGGALMVILKNGYRDYISRRQLKNVKERIGF